MGEKESRDERVKRGQTVEGEGCLCRWGKLRFFFLSVYSTLSWPKFQSSEMLSECHCVTRDCHARGKSSYQLQIKVLSMSKHFDVPTRWLVGFVLNDMFFFSFDCITFSMEWSQFFKITPWLHHAGCQVIRGVVKAEIANKMIMFLYTKGNSCIQQAF